MKTTTKLIAIAFFTLSLSTAFAQKPASKTAISKPISKAKITLATTNDKPTKTVENSDVKTQLIQAWKFHEITLRTPKDGYLFRMADKEVGMINLLVANYTFNTDGSIVLDPKYIEKQGVKEAKWEMNAAGNLVITYFWTPEKQKEAGFTNNYEKMEYKIDVISDKELTISIMDMFVVNLITKN